MVGKIFEVNRISFSDEELPVEGTLHNRGLYITVKCEDFYVTHVMIDGGSGANICPIYTLQKLNIGADRIRPNNVCVRAFDGGKSNSIGEIELMLTIGPVEFIIVFQVLNVDSSYNLLLRRPWIHKAKAVASTLHQMIKFEHDRQEVVIHGEGDLSAYEDSPLSLIEANNVEETFFYQIFDTVPVNRIFEWQAIPGPQLSFASIMMVSELWKYGFEPGKGLGASLHDIVHPICPSVNVGTFGLGFEPTAEDLKKAKGRKKEIWSLPRPMPLLSESLLRAVSRSMWNLRMN